jgi:hypothetical protein
MRSITRASSRVESMPGSRRAKLDPKGDTSDCVSAAPACTPQTSRIPTFPNKGSLTGFHDAAATIALNLAAILKTFQPSTVHRFQVAEAIPTPPNLPIAQSVPYILLESWNWPRRDRKSIAHWVQAPCPHRLPARSSSADGGEDRESSRIGCIAGRPTTLRTPTGPARSSQACGPRPPTPHGSSRLRPRSRGPTRAVT